MGMAVLPVMSMAAVGGVREPGMVLPAPSTWGMAAVKRDMESKAYPLPTLRWLACEDIWATENWRPPVLQLTGTCIMRREWRTSDLSAEYMALLARVSSPTTLSSSSLPSCTCMRSLPQLRRLPLIQEHV
jgi:hypothetical protein